MCRVLQTRDCISSFLCAMAGRNHCYSDSKMRKPRSGRGYPLHPVVGLVIEVPAFSGGPPRDQCRCLHVWEYLPSLGLSEPSGHWAPVVHHPWSLVPVGHTVVGANSTFACRGDPAVGSSLGAWRSGGAQGPLHIWADPWGTTAGALDTACLKIWRPTCMWEVVGLPRKALGMCPSGGMPSPDLHHQVNSPARPMWVTPPLPMAESCPL